MIKTYSEIKEAQINTAADEENTQEEFTGDIKDSPRYCIFENKICPYAEHRVRIFHCAAPSDDDMPCRK